MTEMAEMDYLRELQRQHQLFAEEAFTFLLENSNNKYFKEYHIFQPYIGDAIVTISHIFRKDYRRIFSRLRKNLKHIKMFEKYCMIVPVKKDESYFYYILKRMSVIFELTLYCYKEGYDYFKIGKKCVAEYEDLQYFESVGGWGKLAHTALLIASLGRPLTLIMCHDYNEGGEIIQTFDEAFSTLYKNFIITANLEMIDSAEKFCLMELNKMFQTKVPESEVKCGKKEKTEKENEFFEDLEISPKTNFDYPKGASSFLIAEYFKKCLLDLISSKALGYLINNFDYENMLDAFDLSTIIDVEEFEAFRDPQNSAHHWKADFTGMKVNYIELYKASSPVISAEKIEEFIVEEQLRADLDISEESSVLDISQLDSSLHSPEKILVKIPLSLQKSPEKYLKVMPTDAPEDLDQNSNYDNLDKNSASRKELITPTFIVPKKYLRLTNTDDASKNMHLYTVKMCPPSTRKKLGEPLKKLLDENIDNQNYNVLPSGDILVCRCESSMNNTLIVLAESSSDDEVDDDTDILICLFKKMELDSLGNEKGYSLRSRQLSLLKEDRSGSGIDRVKTKEIMTSDEETPLKKSRTVKCKQATSVGDEKRYAEKLINLYKKYFTYFLDKYFNTEFYSFKMKQCLKDSEINEDDNGSEINEDFKYVFAVTASLMAKRKVLLDEPDENKRLYGIQLYNTMFHPMVLPLEVQMELDLQIRKRNYFVASNGVYGVGPKRRVPRESIWAIFFSGDGKQSDYIEVVPDDIREIPNVFRSYEPILETFLPEDNIELAVRCLQYLLRDFVNEGFHAQIEYP